MIMSVIERIKNLFGFGSQQSMPEDEKEAVQPILPEDEEEPVARSHSPKTPKGYKVLVRYLKARMVNRYGFRWVLEDAVYVVDKEGVKPDSAQALLKELMPFCKRYQYAQVRSLDEFMPEVIVAKDERELGDVASKFDLNTL